MDQLFLTKNCNMLNFHFYIPDYSDKSNGIKSLWLAAEYFSKYRVVTVESVAMGAEICALPQQFKRLVGQFNNNKNTVVVYPDCIGGNPLNASKVGRFLMAKPFILNGLPLDCIDGDFVFACSNAVNEYLPQYNVLFNEKCAKLNIKNIVKKNKASIYYGKIRLSEKFNQIKEIIDIFDEIYVITRAYPKIQNVMYKNIAESKLFISLDPLTHLSYEATLLGTPVYMADDVFRKSYDNYNYPLHGFHYSDEVNSEFIDTYEHEILSRNARTLFEAELSRNDEKTIDILLKIDKFFSKNEKSKIIKYSHSHDIDFYLNDWKLSPIYNCTTSNSLIAYHLARRSVYIFLLVKSFLFLPRKFKQLVSCFIEYSKKIIIKEFGYGTVNLYLYVKNFEKYKARFRNFNEVVVDNDVEAKINVMSEENSNLSEMNFINRKLFKYLWKP